MIRLYVIATLALVALLSLAPAALAQDLEVPTQEAQRAVGPLEAVNFVIGLLMPLLVAVVQRPTWENGVRALVSAGACIVAGVAVTWATVGISLDEELIYTIGTILVAAQASYVAFWKHTGLVPWLEQATTFSRAPTR